MKNRLLEVAGEDENVPVTWRLVSKKLRRPAAECSAMHRMLLGYAKLGKTRIVIENGLRITKCPPAYARGVWVDNKVRAKHG